MTQAYEPIYSQFPADPTDPISAVLDCSFSYDANGNRNTTGYTVGTGGTLSASPNARL
jgi:hypothetical protein